MQQIINAASDETLIVIGWIGCMTSRRTHMDGQQIQSFIDSHRCIKISCLLTLISYLLISDTSLDTLFGHGSWHKAAVQAKRENKLKCVF